MLRRPSSKMHLLAVFTVLFMTFSGHAFAQTNAAGTEKLRGIFDELLGRYETAASTNGATLSIEGDILVEESDDYYAITLPHLSLKQKSGEYTEIGMIAVNAVQGDTDNQWKMTVSVPTPITHFDASNAPIVTTNIGAQSFAGIWNADIDNFTKLNVRYKDVNVEQHAEQTRIMMPDVKIIYDLKETAEKRWSGPANFIVSDLQMYFDRDGSSARIGQINIDSTVKDYSVDAALDYQEKIDAIAESYQEGDKPSISSPHVLGFYNLFVDFMGNTWDGFDFKMGMRDFVLTRPPIPGSPAGHIKISDGQFGFGMDGFRSGLVSMNTGFGYNGFEMVPLAEDYNNATPDHVNLSLHINNLPYQEIVELGRTSLQGTLDNPAAGKLVGLQAIMILPQLLTQAQTNLELKDVSIGNNQYGVLSNGKFTADLAATLGMTGQSRTEITGLDSLITALQSAAESPDLDEKKKKNIQDSLAKLSILKMFGQIEKDENGKEIRVYDLHVTQKGEALLNGTDMQLLLQTIKEKK